MKKHPEHKIDELLDRSLHNLQGETSAQDWEEIRSRLPRSRQDDEPWFWFLSRRKALGIVALLLLSLTGVGYFGLHQAEYHSQEITVAQKIKSVVEEEGNLSKNAVTEKHEIADKSENITNINTHSDNEVKALTGKSKTAKSSRGNPNFSKRKSKMISTQVADNKDIEFQNKLVAKNANSEDVTSEKQLSQTNKIKDNQSVEVQTKESEIAGNITEESKVDSKQEDKTIAVVKEKVAGKSAKQAGNLSGKKFSFGVSFSPNFGGQTTSFDAGKIEQTHKNYYQLRSNNEKPASGYKAGIFAQYYIWKGLNVQTGVQYQQHREKAEYKFYNNEIPVIDSATRNILGYIEIEDTIGTNYTHKNTYSYTVIPLQIGYEFPLSDKWKIGLQAGGNAVFLSRANGQTLRADDLSLTEINNLRKTNFSLTVSPAIYYQFQKYFSVGLEANYTQLLNPVQNSTSTIQTKPWNIGAGVNLRFNPF